MQSVLEWQLCFNILKHWLHTWIVCNEFHFIYARPLFTTLYSYSLQDVDNTDTGRFYNVYLLSNLDFINLQF